MSAARIEPSSFRDPDSRVVESDGAVLRLLSEQGLRDWQALEASKLFHSAVAAGKLVGTEVEPKHGTLPDALVDGAAAVLRHEVVPFVSYPYEWTFAMLKDAALLQLELLAERARRGPDPEGLPRPTTCSGAVRGRSSSTSAPSSGCARASRGSATASSACSSSTRCCSRLTTASRSSPGSAAGSTASSLSEARQLMSFRDLFRSRCAHPRRPAREAGAAERRHDPRREGASSSEAGFKKELIVANIERLRRLVHELDWQPVGSAWSEYGPRTHYTDADTAAKDDFVRRVAARDADGTSSGISAATTAATRASSPTMRRRS